MKKSTSVYEKIYTIKKLCFTHVGTLQEYITQIEKLVIDTVKRENPILI